MGFGESRNGSSPYQTKSEIRVRELVQFGNERFRVLRRRRVHWVRLLRSLRFPECLSPATNATRTLFPPRQELHILWNKVGFSVVTFSFFFSEYACFALSSYFFCFLWGEGEEIEGSLPDFLEEEERRVEALRRPEIRWWSFELAFDASLVFSFFAIFRALMMMCIEKP